MASTEFVVPVSPGYRIQNIVRTAGPGVIRDIGSLKLSAWLILQRKGFSFNDGSSMQESTDVRGADDSLISPGYHLHVGLDGRPMFARY